MSDEAPLTLVWKGVAPAASAGAVVGISTVAPDGRIWVSATALSVFWILDPSGKYVGSWGTPGSGDGPFNFSRDKGDAFGAVAFAPDGSWYGSDTGNLRVQHFDKDGKFLAKWGSFGTGDNSSSAPKASLPTVPAMST